MKRNLVVLQEEKYDCAAASLLSIIKYYGGYINLESIRELIYTKKTGTTAYDLINGSKEIGFDSYGKKVNFLEIENQEKLFPVIAHIKKNNMYHFVVIYQINKIKKYFEIMDPSVGYIKVSFKEFEKNYLGTLIFFSKVKELPKEKKDNKLLKIIILSLFKDKKVIILLSLLSLVTFIFSLLDTVYYKIIIDNIITTKELCYSYSLIFISFTFIKNIFIYLRNKLSIKVNYKIELLINNETLNRIFCLPYSYYKNKSTGEITSRINDLDTLKELLSNLILNTFVDILLILISFIIMFILNKKLTSITIIILLIYIIIIKIYKEKFNKSIRLIQETKGIYNHNLLENIEAIETINNLNIKNIKINKLKEKYKNTSEETKKLNSFINKQHFLKNNVYDMGLIFLLTSGFLLVLKNKITIGDLILIFMIISYFINVIKNLLDKDIDISYTLKNIEKVNALLKDNKIKETNQKVNGSIIVDDLSFAYNSNSKNVKIKSLTIKEGNKVLITGKSGSGKSTLMKIILKNLTNYKGTIKVGNRDLKNVDEQIIRNSFTYIGQNEKLFTDTFKNNIILNREITEYEYEKVIKICELDNLRNSRKFKDSFLIEEGGFNISGGEKERIILARALLKNSNFILIDEALSEVNLELEKKIIKNILTNFKDKTIIYTSHKDKVKELFKKIYNIERSEYERN